MMIMRWLSDLRKWVYSQDLNDFKIIQTKEVYADGTVKSGSGEYHIEYAHYLLGYKSYIPHLVYHQRSDSDVVKTFFSAIDAINYWDKHRKFLTIKKVREEVKL